MLEGSLMNTNVALVAINEFNLDLLRFYVDREPARFRGFGSLLSGELVTTFAEDRHEINEPWIVWPSFFLGCRNDEHQIYELRMRSKSNSIDLMSEVASHEISCSSFFNMNLNPLKPPNFLRAIPSPWEEFDTGLKPKKFDMEFHELVRRLVVMNNTGRIDAGLVFNVMFWRFCFFVLRNFSLWPTISKAIGKNMFKPLTPALFDLLSYRFLTRNIDFEKIKFNSFFFNGLAHVQHHFFNKSLYAVDSQSNRRFGGGVDPFPLILDIYELLLQEIRKDFSSGMVMSGFEQRRYRGECVYYTISHLAFFSETLDVDQSALKRLMSRDFSYEPQSDEPKAELQLIKDKLSAFNIKATGQKIFKFQEHEAQVVAWVDITDHVDDREVVEYFDLTFNWRELFTKNAVKQGTHMGVGWAVGFGGFLKPTDCKHMRVWELRRKVLDEVVERFA